MRYMNRSDPFLVNFLMTAFLLKIYGPVKFNGAEFLVIYLGTTEICCCMCNIWMSYVIKTYIFVLVLIPLELNIFVSVHAFFSCMY